MRIYIFRHGEAAPKNDTTIPSDADRPLTEEGVRRTHQAAQGLKQMGVGIDALFTSPWLRARQTADVVSIVLGVKVQEMEELAGDRSVADVMRALARYAEYENVMLVGHNPLLGEIAAYVLSLATDMQVDLKKSGLCVVETDRIPPKRPGTLLWMMTPKQLRSLR